MLPTHHHKFTTNPTHTKHKHSVKINNKKQGQPLYKAIKTLLQNGERDSKNEIETPLSWYNSRQKLALCNIKRKYNE